MTAPNARREADGLAPLDLHDAVRADEGLVSARVFWDPEIYQLELERVFGRTWLYVAHESEIRRPGDFVTRAMGGDPVIVIRGADGRVRVLLNVCRHRGRKICGEDAGRTATFRCGYHGWTYASTGELTAVPFFEAYQGRLDKRQLGLYEAPGVDAYHGLIFATWSAAAEPLREYLGEFTWMLDLLFGRSEGVEVVGPPIRWTVEANWKLPAGNFAGDGHHLFTTHGFSGALGLKAKRGNRIGFDACMDKGHAAVVTSWPVDDVEGPYLGLPRELWPELEQHLTPTQLEVLHPLQVAVGNVFPNLSFLDTASHTPGEWAGPEMVVSFLTVRQWQPRGPDRMEIWSWLFMERNAPEWWKAASTACYHRVFGMAGLFEQDDTENWAEITQALRGSTARRQWAHYGMGLGIGPNPAWRGPGLAYSEQPPVIEVNERALYSRWQELMLRE
jgi:phenylpropionate dioxygenase-like ring-hydroxylating dioxygenase large terminal subunit